MGNEALHIHQARISRNYIRRISNLIKLERFDEAANDGLYFASILRMWATQAKNLQEKSCKDGSAKARSAFANSK